MNQVYIATLHNLSKHTIHCTLVSWGHALYISAVQQDLKSIHWLRGIVTLQVTEPTVTAMWPEGGCRTCGHANQ
jgi:hypothetical protein